MFVEVPEKELPAWRNVNKRKKKQCPLLAQFNDSGMKYACLKCTHFVNSQKLIAEGNRTYMNLPDGQAMKLLLEDEEGRMIQKQGVLAVVYGPDLWYDQSALMALMREDNANVDVAKPETELDAFGLVHTVVKQLSSGSSPTSITEEDVMTEISKIGFGNLPTADWRQLVRFRLLISTPLCIFLLASMFHVCNGRVRSNVENYGK